MSVTLCVDWLFGYDVIVVKKRQDASFKRSVHLNLYLPGITNRNTRDRVKLMVFPKKIKKSPGLPKRKILLRYMDKVLFCISFSFVLIFIV